ncbi:MAG: hypothetical protein KBI32_00085 [Phycisphaerae bacterium]|nr:hypothetical protein [Phycisphaerae bacterium]HON90487.1 hypothetical protein [Sedimentisphaerales bacterium]
MKTLSLITAATLMLAAAFSRTVQAQGHGDAVAHFHIGINPTWRPAEWSRPDEDSIDSDPTDDSKLWLFSMPPTHMAATPGWPHWEHSNGNTFLVLSPVHEDGQHVTKPDDPSKELYTCNFLYSRANGYGDPTGALHLNGWSSAFGPQGAWNLEAGDPNSVPAWSIQLRRERVSGNLDADDFFMLQSDDTPVLQADGQTYTFPKRWLKDENAWGIHSHLYFYFWLDETDNEVYVVLSVHDTGGRYQRSADVTIRFAKTVVQPIVGDVNNDGIVDIKDLRIVMENWGLSGIYSFQDPGQHDHDEHEHDHEH